MVRTSARISTLYEYGCVFLAHCSPPPPPTHPHMDGAGIFMDVSPVSLMMWWKRKRRNNENVPRDETPKDVYRKTGWEKKNVLIRNLFNFLLHPPSIFPFTLSLAL